MSPTDRYYNDPIFRQIVDQLYYLFENAQMTPTEIREAAMLAQMRYEDCHPRAIFVSQEWMEQQQQIRRKR